MRRLFSNSEINYFKSLTLRDKAIIIYFAMSICSLCVSDDTDLFIIVLIIANFANATRLLRTIPTPPDAEEDTEESEVKQPLGDAESRA